MILSERWRPQAERQQARSRAEQALERARAGESFPELAGAVSEEPGAEARGGLLEPGREGSWVDEFWDAASALEVGAVSPVVETGYGFHVLRLDAREPVPFAEARSRVVAELAAELDDPAVWRSRIAAWTGADPGGSLRGEEMSEDVREILLAEAARRASWSPDPTRHVSAGSGSSGPGAGPARWDSGKGWRPTLSQTRRWQRSEAPTRRRASRGRRSSRPAHRFCLPTPSRSRADRSLRILPRAPWSRRSG